MAGRNGNVIINSRATGQEGNVYHFPVRDGGKRTRILILIFRRSEAGKGIVLIKQVVLVGQVNNPLIRLFRSSQLLLLKRHRFSPFRSLLNTPVFTNTKFFKNFEFANNRLALFIFPFASPDF